MEMSLFKEAREMLLLNHDMKVINDEELLLLLDDNTSRSPEFNYENYQRFNLDEIQEPECKAEFRFNKNDIPVSGEGSWVARNIPMFSKNCGKQAGGPLYAT